MKKTTPKRVLFKPARDWAGRVVLNWEEDPIRDLERMAEGYRAVAHDRVEFLKSQNAPRIYPDLAYQAFPIVFLYRHAFELTLKAVVFAGAVLLHDEDEKSMEVKQIMRHDLMPLFKEATRILERWDPEYTKAPLPPEFSPELPAWPDFEACVREFDEVDRKADTFRYSVKRDRKDNITPTLPSEGFEFDLFVFGEIMDHIIESLIHVPGYLREEMQGRWEGAYEAQREDWAAEYYDSYGDYDYDYDGRE